VAVYELKIISAFSFVVLNAKKWLVRFEENENN